MSSHSLPLSADSRQQPHRLRFFLRIGEAGEIAAAVLFLTSNDASFVNGAILTVDGGWSAY